MAKRILRPSNRVGIGWIIVAVVPDDYSLNVDERSSMKEGKLRFEQVPEGQDPWILPPC